MNEETEFCKGGEQSQLSIYKNTLFRSRLEAQWAYVFTKLGWKWCYECTNACGEYVIDFNLDGRINVEIKPETSFTGLEPHKARCEKIKCSEDVDCIVLFGGSASAPIQLYSLSTGWINVMPAHCNECHGPGFEAENVDGLFPCGCNVMKSVLDIDYLLSKSIDGTKTKSTVLSMNGGGLTIENWSRLGRKLLLTGGTKQQVLKELLRWAETYGEDPSLAGECKEDLVLWLDQEAVRVRNGKAKKEQIRKSFRRSSRRW